MSKRGKAEKWAARGERLSAALRENLKRRKEQARARGLAGDLAHDSEPGLDRGLNRDPARNRALQAPAADATSEDQNPGFRRNPDGK
jgi:hypothetical protein